MIPNTYSMRKVIRDAIYLPDGDWSEKEIAERIINAINNEILKETSISLPLIKEIKLSGGYTLKFNGVSWSMIKDE